MDIEKIENFIVFSECMNFSVAANRVFIDPSVFHRQISSIENELGIQLIQRENRAMVLTPAGESFANGMKKVLELYHREVQKAEDLNAGIRGSIQICNVFGHALSNTLSAMINQFEAAYPDIRISLISRSISDSRELLQKGYTDFVVARDELYSSLDDTDSLKIETIHSGIAIHSSLLPPAVIDSDPDTFDYRVLDRFPLVFCREMMSKRGGDFLEEREHRLGPQSVIWVSDIEETYSYLELKKGFTLINDLNFFKNSPDICYIPNKANEIRHSIIWKTTNTNKCVKIFTDYIQTQCAL